MGDVPISYIEGVGGIRVSEDEIVEVGKHDVRIISLLKISDLSYANNLLCVFQVLSFKVGR